MAKPKIRFNCSECGTQTSKWVGQCPDCGSWNTLVEAPSSDIRRTASSVSVQDLYDLADLDVQPNARMLTGLGEFDRVLGGGLVKGAVVLLGGDPGIGKSTLLLQTLSLLSQQVDTLYVSGEESAQQIALRGRRLGVDQAHIKVMTDNSLESVIGVCKKSRPDILAIDSIQTLYTDLIQSAPGSVSQVRETAAQLVRYAKQSGTTVLIVGHVTKEGAIAGPRVLEHIVDTVLYFEGDRSSSFRLIRAIKNRFGAVNEIGVFAMLEQGLREVSNPSAMFINRDLEGTSGRIVMATQEGSRPMLLEVQALVDQSPLANPRRLTVGLDASRLAMILAVLHRHGGVNLYDQDVFVNVVGGVKVLEPASDLAVTLALVSSLKNNSWPQDLVVFGEIGLGGEIRPVQNGADRLKEAFKLGFKQAIIPKGNVSKHIPHGMAVIPVQKIDEAISKAYEL